MLFKVLKGHRFTQILSDCVTLFISKKNKYLKWKNICITLKGMLYKNKEINVEGNMNAHGLSVVSCPESSILPNFLFFMPHVFPKLSYPFTRRKGLP